MGHQRFLVHFSLAMGAYVVAVVISVLLLINLHGGALRTLSALLPVLPMIAVAIVVIRQIRHLDELARLIHLEGLAVAFVGTALVTFSYGFLETAGFPRLSMFLVWSLMAPLWALGSFFAWRRYR
ncbi:MULTISPECIES: hypothetical protein [Stutzerimonas stutzeri subgroup]|jgi:hypothetical protein|uniref:Transmembrane protein n=1 Tax=Stutzerimonas stutzeri NF13 TaxID=1212548 RepID=M2UIA5_STUST|nr:MULTISPECIES: hypothetical protein [Stutzerimonas stutzeri subgroup]MBS67445.1 hypothetical protein [Pseudomonas sp.]EMD98209.1 hypothetical protein B381_20926 [Stutzerimonas stutzeri NF13]MBK3806198.1 hypothetical protein [Stutzerimonas stutzeri]MBK3853339.1 hypothetical protein [Stutzerimonas stutzeri]MBK3879302.1 hypothetical protein [Stutzerimonas stutzeri]|tara:strand:- start:3398 stop:3772 length:375 start_codon:yes stop_codon:yes gene_type:complete